LAMSSKKVLPFRLFKNTEKAVFITRPNRFTIICEFKGKKITAYLPNPGRLWELLLPEAQVYLEKTNRDNRKIPYTVVAVQKKTGLWFFILIRQMMWFLFSLKKVWFPGLKAPG